jgi:hypothetical protein
MSHKMSRREFLRTSAMATAGVVFDACRKQKPQWQETNSNEAGALKSVSRASDSRNEVLSGTISYKARIPGAIEEVVAFLDPSSGASKEIRLPSALNAYDRQNNGIAFAPDGNSVAVVNPLNNTLFPKLGKKQVRDAVLLLDPITGQYEQLTIGDGLTPLSLYWTPESDGLLVCCRNGPPEPSGARYVYGMRDINPGFIPENFWHDLHFCDNDRLVLENPLLGPDRLFVYYTVRRGPNRRRIEKWPLSEYVANENAIKVVVQEGFEGSPTPVHLSDGQLYYITSKDLGDWGKSSCIRKVPKGMSEDSLEQRINGELESIVFSQSRMYAAVVLPANPQNNETNPRQIYVAELGGEPVVLEHTNGEYLQVAFSPDGGYIAVHVRGSDRDGRDYDSIDIFDVKSLDRMSVPIASFQIEPDAEKLNWSPAEGIV